MLNHHIFKFRTICIFFFISFVSLALNLTIFVDKVLSQPPLPPQNLRIVSYGNDATLEWDANTEPNLDHYVIYWGIEFDPPYGYNSEDKGDFINKNTTTYTVTGLSVDRTYYFAAKAFDTEGLGSNYSNVVSTTVDPADPADPKAPQIISPPTVTSITDITAIIEWQTDEPSTSVVQYDDNSSTWGNYLWGKTNTSLVTTHSVTLTGLTADTRYYFRVGSTDGFNNGPTTSNEVTFTTELTPDTTAPQMISGPTVAHITDTTAIITWTTDEHSTSMVEYGVTASYGSQATLTDYVTNHIITLTFLAPVTLYHFRVSSTDATANGPTYSNDYTFATELIPDTTAPQITSPPTVTNITNSTAVITWETDEPSNSIVRYDATSGDEWADYSSSKDDLGMVTSHSVTLTGFVANQTYYFMVGSADAFGNGPNTSDTDNNPSAEQYFTTALTPDTNAPVISNVIVAGTSNTTAIITWQTDEPSNSMVQYGSSSRTWSNYSSNENNAGMVTSHSVTLTGLLAGTQYFFRVGSTDASGNGSDLNSNATNPSAEDSFITDFTPDTNAPVIASVTVAGTTDTTAMITWTTDEPSNSMVQYNTISSTWGNYTWNKNNAQMVTSHSVTLTGLTKDTTYHFRVGSNDASGNGPDLNSNATNPSAEDSFTTNLTPDTTAPVISNVIVASTTDTTAMITWTTDEPSNSMVQYNTISSTWGNYTWSKNNAQMVTSHSVTLTGLTKDTTYHFRVGSTDASGNGPGLNLDPTNPSDDNNFDTTNNDNDPPSITGYSINYVNDTIDITYDEANMQNANIEDNYSFSPNLYFRTAGGSDDITYRGSNTYRLFMAFIPENTGFILTVTGITDEAGNPVDPDYIAIDIPPPPGDIKEVIPHNKAGIDDSTRVPHNTSFAARIEDIDGIDILNPESITFTIDDGVNLVDGYNLGNSDVVRVVQLDSTESADNVTKFWVIYDRSMDDWYGNVFNFGATVTISVDAKDRNGNLMDQGTYSFKVETEVQYNNAIGNLPPTTTTPDSPSPGLTTISFDSGDLVGAKIIFDSNETVSPIFGPLNELPALSISGVNGVGVPMNLQPSTVFNAPVKIFIPCPEREYASTLNVYRYNGTSWVLACDVGGNVETGGEGWIVPGSRVNHDNGSPSTIEIQVYHFTGVQAGSQSGSGSTSSTAAGGGGGCFIATAVYGTAIEPHVKVLRDFRDRFLINNNAGKAFIDLYNTYSPPVADFIASHDTMRLMVRWSLMPIVGMSWMSLNLGPWITLALIGLLICLLILGVVVTLRRKVFSPTPLRPFDKLRTQGR